MWVCKERDLIVLIFWKYYLGLGNDCLDMTLETCTIKEKVDKLDFIKIDNLCASKDAITKNQ